MRIILHADDFGFNQNTTESTIDLLENGELTSATIMVNMPATELALEYARNHKDKSFGVHLTYVDGLTPCSQDIPSLTNSNGKFLPSNDIRKKALTFTINKEEIVRESLAQIKVLEDSGVAISHLDSHGHLHKFPSFLLSLNEIVQKSGIERVRRVQNIFLNKPKVSPTTILNGMFAHYIEKKFKTTDYFYMSANSMDTHWTDSLLNQLDKLPQNSIIEVGVHPGTLKTGEEAWRAEEYRDIKEFANKIKNGGKHEIISWNEV